MKVSKLLLVLIIWWIGLFVVSIINIININTPGPMFYFMWALFILTYFLSFNIGSSTCLSVRKNEKYVDKISNLFHSKILALVLFIAFVFNVRYAIIFFELTVVDNLFSESRGLRFEVGPIFKSNVELILFTWFIVPLITIGKFVLAVGFIKGRLISLNSVLSLFLCISYVAFGAGRMIVLDIAVLALFFKFILPKEEVRNKSLGISISVLVLILAAATLPMYLRSGSFLSNDIIPSLMDSLIKSIEHLILYSVGPFSAFDLSYVRLWDANGFGFGKYTLSSLHEPIAHLFKLLGYATIPSADQIGIFTRENIVIGNDVEFNALYTGLLPFYLDFNIFGIMFFTIPLGFITGFLCRKSALTGDIYASFLASYLFLVSFMMTYSWRLASFGSIVPILLIMIVKLVAKSKVIKHK